jgi:hypothetical protein
MDTGAPFEPKLRAATDFEIAGAPCSGQRVVVVEVGIPAPHVTLSSRMTTFKQACG